MLGIWMVYLAVYQVDDAYIIYRYAENLAHGHGLVFNEGERVEGVSCFLWTVALALVAKLGFPLPATAPVVTALSGLAAAALLPGLSARARGRAEPDGFDVAAAALLAAAPSFAYWSVGSLETVPYTLLLVLALRDQLSENETGRGVRSAVWMGLATLVRPEAPLVAGALAVGRALDKNQTLRGVARWCAVVAAFFVPFLAFRRIYYGDWLPNTYYAKAGGGLAVNLYRGRAYASSFLSSLCPAFGVDNAWTAAAGGIGVAALLVFGARRRKLRGAALLVAAVFVAVVLEGGDWMAFHRFFVPALPFLAMLAAAGASTIVEHRPFLRIVAAAAGAAIVASFVTTGIAERNSGTGLVVNAEGYRHAHHEVARLLKERAQPGDTVALMDVGIIGYESGLRVIDISGLTTRETAHAPGSFLAKEFPPSMILEKQPRFIVLVAGFPIDMRIAQDQDFRERYALVLELNHRFNWSPPSEYWLGVFERKRT